MFIIIRDQIIIDEKFLPTNVVKYFLTEMLCFFPILFMKFACHEKILISLIRESLFPRNIRKSSMRESLFQIFRDFFSSRKCRLAKVSSRESVVSRKRYHAPSPFT